MLQTVKGRTGREFSKGLLKETTTVLISLPTTDEVIVTQDELKECLTRHPAQLVDYYLEEGTGTPIELFNVLADHVDAALPGPNGHIAIKTNSLTCLPVAVVADLIKKANSDDRLGRWLESFGQQWAASILDAAAPADRDLTAIARLCDCDGSFDLARESRAERLYYLMYDGPKEGARKRARAFWRAACPILGFDPAPEVLGAFVAGAADEYRRRQPVAG